MIKMDDDLYVEYPSVEVIRKYDETMGGAENYCVLSDEQLEEDEEEID
jgi:hypothetical protein